jgi:hypothetical protein
MSTLNYKLPKKNVLYYYIDTYDLDFFVFCHRFHIMSPKFPQSKRVLNEVKKFELYDNEITSLIDIYFYE